MTAQGRPRTGKADASTPRGGGEFAVNVVPLLGASIGASFGLGLLTPVYSILFRALEQEFHWSKAAAAASLVALPLTALTLPIIGRLLDRFGVAAVALGSTLGLSACLFALSMMDGGLTQYYAISAVLAVLGGGAGPISYTRVIAQDFHKARGLALALALAGGAVTGMVAPILVSQAVVAEGWRHAYRLLALVTLAGGVLAVALIRGHRAKAPVVEAVSRAGRTVREALRMPSFWLLGAVLFLVSVACIGFFSQLQSIGIDKGLTPPQAAWMLSLLALSVIPSRLIVGWAFDVVDPRFAGAAALILAAAGALVVLLTPQGELWMFALGVVMIGASLGAEFDLMSFFCARCFGLKHYASIFGLLMAAFYIGYSVGGVGYGAVHDQTRSYAIALIGSALLLVLASLLLLALPRRPLTLPPGPHLAVV